MGWFWSTNPSPPKPASEGRRDTTAAPPPSKSSNTDVDNDPELQRFLAMFTEELRGSTVEGTNPTTTTPSPPAPHTSQTPSPPPSKPITSWFSRTASQATTAPQEPDPAITAAAAAREPTPAAAALAQSLRPTTMSCRQAFDLAWGCQSPVGQFNAVYRYGSPRSCSELWGDFWFCMRTRAWGPEQKAAAIQEHYRQKEEAKYGGGKPSSEDVWRSRDEKVPPGTAFTMRLEDAAPDVTDEEQIRADIERRRRTREELGYEKPSRP